MSTTPAKTQLEEFFSRTSPHFGRLREYVRHQIAYFEATGDLPRGELTAQEVVDAVVVRAAREYSAGRGDPEIGSWLMQLASEHLHAEIKRLKAERETMAHIEEDIPETPPEEEVASAGDEIFEFYQPDEDLKLEDIFPDQDVSTPEDMAAAKEELLHCVNAALAGMPEESRRALRLRHAGGLTNEELAELLDKAEPEVERILEYARAHLRQHLLQAGCTFIVKGSDTPGRKRKSSKNR